MFEAAYPKVLTHYSEFTITEVDASGERTVVVKGTAKWDGCINWYTADDQALHSCSREDLLELVAVIETIREHVRNDRGR